MTVRASVCVCRFPLTTLSVSRKTDQRHVPAVLQGVALTLPVIKCWRGPGSGTIPEARYAATRVEEQYAFSAASETKDNRQLLSRPVIARSCSTASPASGRGSQWRLFTARIKYRAIRACWGKPGRSHQGVSPLAKAATAAARLAAGFAFLSFPFNLARGCQG